MQASAADLRSTDEVQLDLMQRLRANCSWLSGAVGGPLVVGTLTPQRNAMTLAAKDQTSTFLGIYRQVFNRGFFSGYRGGKMPSIAAIPQFTAIGPVYLMAERRLQSPALSLFAAALTESTFTYAAQARNAQIQYNAARRTAGAEALALQPLHRLMGPGFVAHVGRNMFAMMGIRLISPFSYGFVCQVPFVARMSEDGRLIASDLVSSVMSATISMPFNHIFSWAVCTPELHKMGYVERAKASIGWLVGTYRKQGMKLLVRDLGCRICYTGFLFTGYRFVERNFVRLSETA